MRSMSGAFVPIQTRTGEKTISSRLRIRSYPIKTAALLGRQFLVKAHICFASKQFLYKISPAQLPSSLCTFCSQLITFYPASARSASGSPVTQRRRADINASAANTSKHNKVSTGGTRFASSIIVGWTKVIVNQVKPPQRRANGTQILP